MTPTCQPTSEVHDADVSVETRRDGALGRITVRTDDAGHPGDGVGRLLREAVLVASRDGLRTVVLTLDVSSPACGAALAELGDLARDDVGVLRVRRAGQTILVDLDLVPTVAAAARVLLPRRAPAHRRGAPIETVRRAQRHLRAQLAGRSGVCGVGLARSGDGYVVRVDVTDADVVVPGEVEGLPVDVRVTGPLTALPRRD
jgi:hypothetical protein